MGSLAVDPGPGSCPYCGRRIGPRFALRFFHRRGSPARKLFAVRRPPNLDSPMGQLGEDVRYLAGIIGWPAAIWKVTRPAVLNTLLVLVCVLALALPQMHPIGKAIVGVVLAVQVGRLLFFLRRVRRDANQSRLTERLASGTRPGNPPKIVGSRPPTGSPRGVNLAQLPLGGSPVRPDQ